jgi:hypothetical protein
MGFKNEKLQYKLQKFGYAPGLWPPMLQSAKCGATVVLVDNCLRSVQAFEVVVSAGWYW